MLTWLPENISTYGHKIDDIIGVIYAIVGVWFVVVQAILFYFLIKFRRRPGVQASFIPGDTWKSMMWIIIPVILVLCFDIGIDLMQGPAWNEIKIDRPANPDYQVKAVAQQFLWEFVYPGSDNRFGTEDDVTSLSELVVPANKKIMVLLESKDVIHSFWVPTLRLKQDVVPGRRIMAWFEPVKTGTYEIACAELCGAAHGNMKGSLRITSEAEFNTWITAQAQKTDDIY